MNTTTLNMTTLDGGVIIKKGTAPAPPSGGESGGSNVEYLDVSAAREEIIGILFQFGILIKGHTTEGINNMEISATGITPYYWDIMDRGRHVVSVKAVAIDFTQKLGMKAGGNIIYYTVLEALLQNGFTQAEFDAIPRITKEQFDTLE